MESQQINRSIFDRFKYGTSLSSDSASDPASAFVLDIGRLTSSKVTIFRFFASDRLVWVLVTEELVLVLMLAEEGLVWVLVLMLAEDGLVWVWVLVTERLMLVLVLAEEEEEEEEEGLVAEEEEDEVEEQEGLVWVWVTEEDEEEVFFSFFIFSAFPNHSVAFNISPPICKSGNPFW